MGFKFSKCSLCGSWSLRWERKRKTIDLRWAFAKPADYSFVNGQLKMAHLGLSVHRIMAEARVRREAPKLKQVINEPVIMALLLTREILRTTGTKLVKYRNEKWFNDYVDRIFPYL